MGLPLQCRDRRTAEAHGVISKVRRLPKTRRLCPQLRAEAGILVPRLVLMPCAARVGWLLGGLGAERPAVPMRGLPAQSWPVLRAFRQVTIRSCREPKQGACPTASVRAPPSNGAMHSGCDVKVQAPEDPPMPCGRPVRVSADSCRDTAPKSPFRPVRWAPMWRETTRRRCPRCLVGSIQRSGSRPRPMRSRSCRYTG